MRTLGIDLASQPTLTAACEIEWGERAATVSLVDVGVDDPQAIPLMRRADVVGIDAPFGWPLTFVDWVRRHHTEGGGTKEWPPDYKKSLQFRRTDFRVCERLHLWPLSVSSDRIAITAMRCAGLLDRLEVVDRSGSGQVVEVYPAAAVKSWGLPFRGYKGPKNQAVLADLARELFEACPWLNFADGFGERCARSDHAFDALVASLVARATALGLTERPPAEDLAAAQSEGWITVPDRDALALLPQRARQDG